MMAVAYEQEQGELKRELAALTSRISEADIRESYVREFIRKATEYVEMPTLTPELLRTFIRRIEVCEKTEKYSRTVGNHVDIYYTFQPPETYSPNTLVLVS